MAMTTPNQVWFPLIMSFIRPWLEKLPRPPLSVKEEELIQFRLDLEQCSEDQKLRVMTLIMLYYPSMSRETEDVCKAYYTANRSIFLRKWRNTTRKVEDAQFSYIYYHRISYQLRELFTQIDDLSARMELIRQLLLTSPISITRKIISVYMYYMWMMLDTEELDIVPPHYWQEEDKQHLIVTLSQSSSQLTRRIFLLHQQLASQILVHFQQMMHQMDLDIDTELERLLQEAIASLVHVAVDDVNENNDSETDWDIDDGVDDYNEFENPDSE